MVWWHRARSDEDRKTLSAIEEFFAAARQTSAGIAVTPLRALEVVPVRAAVVLRSETLAALPIRIYQRLDGGGKERAVDHPLYPLLTGFANPWTSSADLVQALERDQLLHGNGYAALTRIDGRPAELIRLDPQQVTVEADSVGEPRYLVSQPGGSRRQYLWTDVLHVTAPDGFSAVRQAREAIGLYSALEGHAARIFGNGGRPSGIIKLKGKVAPGMLERLKASWSAAHSGSASGSTAILEEGAEWEPLTFNSVDLQYAEMRAFQLVEIARAFGVPPTLVQDFSRATWANFEPAAQAFLSFTLVPRIRHWQGAITRLLTPEERDQFSVEFETAGLVRADIEKRFAAYASAISSRILNPNEARERENMPPYAGGEAFENPNITPGSAAA